MTKSGEQRAIVVEGMLVQDAETIWRALTEPELVARWLMPNDFAAEVGHRFTFRSAPMGDWDGVTEGEVLDAEPFWRLRYTWRGGSETLAGFGRYIDTVLTWTLSPLPNGTHVRLEHAGFTPDAMGVYEIMSSENGWHAVVDRLAKVVVELDEAD